MAGMEALGRLVSQVPKASGVALSMRDCSGIMFYGTNDDTFTLTVSATFGGSYTAPSGWAPVTRWYQETSNGAGTAAWTDQTQAASNAVVQAADDGTVFHLLASQMPAGMVYVKCTATTADGLLVATLYDLNVGRDPANLAIVSA
jgi:hypothetical protein